MMKGLMVPRSWGSRERGFWPHGSYRVVDSQMLTMLFKRTKEPERIRL